MKDSQFATTLMVIIGVLIGSTVGILALANVLISDADYSHDSVIQGNIEDRTSPIGSVNVAGETSVDDATQDSSDMSSEDTQTVADASLSVDQLYTQGCSACHATGVANAPKLGDKVGWKPRIAKGVDQLYASAINGIPGTTMIAKGGRVDYSDDDIKKIVDYMLESVQ